MRKQLYLFTLILALSSFSFAQSFKTIVEAPNTAPKNQAQSSTCWSFGTVSFIESEIMRTTGKELDISEIYIVYYTWMRKIEKHIRMQGHTFLTAGGQAHDVMRSIAQNDFLLEEEFPVKLTTEGTLDHFSLDSNMQAYIDTLDARHNWRWTTTEKDFITALLNKYIADPSAINIPENTKKYQFNPEDYIQLTSFTHQPYYTAFPLETRYNWADGLYYNLPLDEFMFCIDFALKNGYSLVWNGDVSERSFNSYTGIATLFVDDASDSTRQALFDAHTTKVDHIMHIVGIAERRGIKEKYYKIKNSWGDTGPYNGYLFMSERYMRLKCVSVMLHKDAIPKYIKEQIFQ